MNLALKQFWMHVVFAKGIIQLASFIKACTSTSIKPTVRDACRFIAAVCCRARLGQAGHGRAVYQLVWHTRDDGVDTLQDQGRVGGFSVWGVPSTHAALRCVHQMPFTLQFSPMSHRPLLNKGRTLKLTVQDVNRDPHSRRQMNICSRYLNKSWVKWNLEPCFLNIAIEDHGSRFLPSILMLKCVHEFRGLGCSGKKSVSPVHTHVLRKGTTLSLWCSFHWENGIIDHLFALHRVGMNVHDSTTPLCKSGHHYVSEHF